MSILGPHSTIKDCYDLLEYDGRKEPFTVQFFGQYTSTAEYIGVRTNLAILVEEMPDTKANSVSIGYAARTPGFVTSGSILSFSGTRVKLDVPMATLDDIRKSVSEMTDEELEDIIRGKRKMRDEKLTKKKSKPKAENGGGRAAKLFDQLDALTPEQKLEILKSLGGTE